MGISLPTPMLKERLLREAESNIAIRVSEAAEKDSIELAGRGELQRKFNRDPADARGLK